ncbi:hypothetical protein SAMN05216570_1877 [Dyella sp. OK004]|uniref:hypothetical protein n=1 Tax=Dyella sp. OK004 TaxID=1855292 RepID=UPI0008E03410|nr:hypothetical protein [Dyella sp. OK004]SFS04570.1 hypothetical protein SAMN05216570_1877 [Dyella sp. OK004]
MIIVRRAATILCMAALAFATASHARGVDPSTQELFKAIRPLTDDLARYRYLAGAMRKLPPDDRMVARQLLATTENELGMYAEALAEFPIDSRKVYTGPLPQPGEWQAVDAAEAIARLAAERRVVMVNEAHHDAHTRQLTLALLPRLRALGFTHFALEALGDRDETLAARGYPTWSSGSEYMHEPVFGEIVRKAIALGFIIVPYDADSDTAQGRESGQARNLYQRVLTGHPEARLFVHAGYAHIDKTKGRLGDASPMAAQLKELSGIEPLSIDQTQFREANPRLPLFAYDQLVASFQPTQPIVLLHRGDDHAWSSEPLLHDISVILPPDKNAADIGKEQPSWYTLDGQAVAAKSWASSGLRPDWLSLQGQRYPMPINTTLCGGTLPCVVEAYYQREPYEAVAADRYAFLQPDTKSMLYLFPGTYRLRAKNADGKTLSEQTVSITAR